MEMTDFQIELVNRYGYYCKINDLKDIATRGSLINALEGDRIVGIRIGGRTLRIYVPSLENFLKTYKKRK